MDKLTIEHLNSIKAKIRSAYLSVSAHPDCEPNSEFEDMANGLDEAIEIINEVKERSVAE